MSKESTWSVQKYDLKTALDVLGLPCVVKAAGDMCIQSESQSGSRDAFGSAVNVPVDNPIKLVSEISIYSAHARILKCYDSAESPNDEASMEYYGREILIPLDYNGRTRIHQLEVGKEYFNISEVIEDFPRVVRVEAECACASPGQTAHQLVSKGTVLELDRVTESSWSFRGIRHPYLMCIDRKGNRELAFPVLSTVHFTKIRDDTTYTVKEIVECLPLPQTIQFVNINPYDNATADDDLARDLLRMLSGLVQITGIRRTQCIVGLLQQTAEESIRTVVIPKKDNLLNGINVHIPNTCVVDNLRNFADETIPGDIDLDIIRNKLYLQYADQSEILILKSVMTSHEYNTEELQQFEDTIPLTTSISSPSMPTDKPDIGMSRKRCLSSGDAESPDQCNGSLHVSKTDRQFQGRNVRGYLSHIARRIKSGVSQVWLGVDKDGTSVPSPPGSPRDISKLKSRGPDTADQNCVLGESEGYVCYLDAPLASTEDHESSQRYVDVPFATGNEQRTGRCTPPHIHVTSGDSEPVYATVDFSSKHYTTIDVIAPSTCPICQENTKIK